MTHPIFPQHNRIQYSTNVIRCILIVSPSNSEIFFRSTWPDKWKAAPYLWAANILVLILIECPSSTCNEFCLGLLHVAGVDFCNLSVSTMFA